MKNNSIPKDLVPLEDLFDKNDVAKNMKATPNSDELEDYIIGTNVDATIIKLSKDLDSENRKRCITLIKYFSDVFAWSYEDLKEYGTSIIQHKIPIKENEKPFR